MRLVHEIHAKPRVVGGGHGDIVGVTIIARNPITGEVDKFEIEGSPEHVREAFVKALVCLDALEAHRKGQGGDTAEVSSDPACLHRSATKWSDGSRGRCYECDDPGAQSPLRSLSYEEQTKLQPLTKEDVDAALERGRQDRLREEDARFGTQNARGPWDELSRRYVEQRLPELVAESRRAPIGSKLSHAITDVGECTPWCDACRENIAWGLNPDGTEKDPKDLTLKDVIREGLTLADGTHPVFKAQQDAKVSGLDDADDEVAAIECARQIEALEGSKDP
jgi:hypothetical protein